MSAQNAPQSDDRIEKLITVLGQRMNALTKTLQMIAESLQGVELLLREMSISSNPAPNYRRPLSDYRDFDWASISLEERCADRGRARVVPAAVASGTHIARERERGDRRRHS